MRALIWVSKSLDKLAAALVDLGHRISPNTVSKLLTGTLGFSRQGNRKADEGSIRTWIERFGRARYDKMRELTITADCGGSNGARVRLWKVELQKLADETRLTIHVHHYPPGTSKWNRIEHRLFCHITQNWRGKPLTDRLAIVELIGATTTKAGLKVDCLLDDRTYEKGIKVADAEMQALDIEGDAFHPEWNYTINPRNYPEP
jgi:hypothetical protein